jgi:hypothetical protein
MHFCSTRHKPDFGGKSEAGKSEAILSARQHRPEGQNPIALTASRRNTAQAWLGQSMIWKSGHRLSAKIMHHQRPQHDLEKWQSIQFEATPL